MSKRPASASKRLTQPNLALLGAEALATLLMELGDSSPALKRRLRMELAAAVGPEPLAAEIDKRMTFLATSKAKVSWRKRGDLILDLHVLRRMIADRLGALDAAMAMSRLLAFLDLADGLAARVKDPKGELAPVFEAAAEDLATLAEASPPAPPAIAQQLADILLRARATWAAWLPTILPPLGQPFGAALMAALDAHRAARPAFQPSAAVLRAIADAAGDVDGFIATIPANLRQAPANGAAIGARLLDAGRVEGALTALRDSNPASRGGRFGLGRTEADQEDIDLWQGVWIDALEKSGDLAGAQAERWAAFEQSLSPDPLRAYLKRLADFDDVVATDKAIELAAAYRPFSAGLAFLMGWPALNEAAGMVLARRAEIDGGPETLRTWADRLEGRYPLAALLLLRAAIASAWKHRPLRIEAEGWLNEAEALASRIEDARDVESHAAFVSKLGGRRLGGRR